MPGYNRGNCWTTNATSYKTLGTTSGISGQAVLRELKGKNMTPSEPNYFSQLCNSKLQATVRPVQMHHLSCLSSVCSWAVLSGNGAGSWVGWSSYLSLFTSSFAECCDLLIVASREYNCLWSRWRKGRETYLCDFVCLAGSVWVCSWLGWSHSNSSKGIPPWAWVFWFPVSPWRFYWIFWLFLQTFLEAWRCDSSFSTFIT